MRRSVGSVDTESASRSVSPQVSKGEKLGLALEELMYDDTDPLTSTPRTQVQILKKRFDWFHQRSKEEQPHEGTASNLGDILKVLDDGKGAPEVAGEVSEETDVLKEIAELKTRPELRARLAGQEKPQEEEQRTLPIASREEMAAIARRLRRKWKRQQSAPPVERPKFIPGQVGSELAQLQVKVTELKKQVQGLADTPAVKALKEQVAELKNRLGNQQSVIRGLKDRILADPTTPFTYHPSTISDLPTDNQPTTSSDVTIVIASVENISEIRAWSAPRASGVISTILSAMRQASIDTIGYLARMTEEGECMYSFADPRQATMWALAVHEMLNCTRWPEELCERLLSDRSTFSAQATWNGPRVRIAIATGPAIAHEDPLTGRVFYYGPVALVTAQLHSVARGGDTLITPEVKSLLDSHHFLEGSQAPLVSKVVSANDAPPVHAHRLISRALEKRSPVLNRPVTLPQHMVRPTEVCPCIGMAVQVVSSQPGISSEVTETAPMEGTITFVCLTVDRFREISCADSQAAEEALITYHHEIRRILEERHGYESRVERHVSLYAFASIVDAVNFAWEVLHTLVYCEWPHPVLSHPAGQPIVVGGRMLMQGLRAKVGIHACAAKVIVDHITARVHYLGCDVACAVAASAVAYGGEVVVTTPIVQILQNPDLSISPKLGCPKYTKIRPLIVQGAPRNIDCYQLMAEQNSAVCLYFGREHGRNVGTVQDQSEAERELLSLRKKLSQAERECAALKASQESTSQRAPLVRKMAVMAPETSPRRRRSSKYRSMVSEDLGDRVSAAYLRATRGNMVLQATEFAALLQRITRKAWERVPDPSDEVTVVLLDVQGVDKVREEVPPKVFQHSMRAVHDCVVATVLSHGGQQTAKVGEGYLLLFPTVDQALEWCGAVQRELMHIDWPQALERTSETATVMKDEVLVWSGPRLRVGVHLCAAGGGEVSLDRDYVTGLPTVFGVGVNAAAIAHRKALGGEVLVTGAVARAVEGKTIRGAVTPFGEVALSNGTDLSRLMLHRFTPEGLEMRRELFERECSVSDGIAAQVGPPPGVVFSVCVQLEGQPELRRLANTALPELEVVFDRINRALEGIVSELEGCPAQRILDFGNEDPRHAMGLFVFPTATAALSFAVRVQMDMTTLDLPLSVQDLSHFRPVWSSSSDTIPAFRGPRMKVGVFEAADVERHVDHSLLSSGLIYLSPSLSIPALLCCAAYGGEILIPSDLLGGLSGVAECVVHRVTQLRVEEHAARAVDVYQVIPKRFESRSDYFAAAALAELSEGPENPAAMSEPAFAEVPRNHPWSRKEPDTASALRHNVRVALREPQSNPIEDDDLRSSHLLLIKRHAVEERGLRRVRRATALLEKAAMMSEDTYLLQSLSREGTAVPPPPPRDSLLTALADEADMRRRGLGQAALELIRSPRGTPPRRSSSECNDIPTHTILADILNNTAEMEESISGEVEVEVEAEGTAPSRKGTWKKGRQEADESPIPSIDTGSPEADDKDTSRGEKTGPRKWKPSIVKAGLRMTGKVPSMRNMLPPAELDGASRDELLEYSALMFDQYQKEKQKREEGSNEFLKLHRIVRNFSELLQHYLEQAVDVTLHPTEEDFFQPWVREVHASLPDATLPTDERRRKRDTTRSMTRLKKRSREEVLDFCRCVIDESKEAFFEGSHLKLMRSIVGHCSTLYLYTRGAITHLRRQLCIPTSKRSHAPQHTIPPAVLAENADAACDETVLPPLRDRQVDVVETPCIRGKSTSHGRLPLIHR